jgi:hypothetical protein
LGLKITATVSWLGPQNQVGFGLSVTPQNRRREVGAGHTSRSSGLRICEKHAQYYVLGLLSFIAGHIIDPPIHEILLSLRLHLISYSRGCRPGGALPCEMASQTTLQTCSTCTASLNRCTLRGWSIRAGTLLQVLAGWLLHAGSRWLLLRPLHLEGVALALASAADSSAVI